MDRVLGEQLKSGRPSEDQGMRDTGESVQQIELETQNIGRARVRFP